MIHLTAADLHFLGDNEKERRRDLCLHGSVFLSIDGTVLCDGGEWCVSASALRFMRTVFVDHISASGDQMIPCCGHFMIPSGDGKTVDIVGCSNGIDFDVIHESGGITVKTADGEKFFVNCSEYRRAVTGFAGQIEQFISNSPSRIFDDDWDRAAVSVFRNEWTALRQRLSPSDLPFPGIFL